MKKRLMTSIGVAALAVVVLTGCGSGGSQTAKNNPSSSSNSSASQSITTKNGTIITNGKPYHGAAILKKYQAAAKKKPNDFKAQMNAAIASHVNGDDAAAIKYYEAASKINPKSAVPHNNIGNIYLRDKKEPKKALPYYQKATKVDSTYGFGWYNLAITENDLGHTAAAKHALANGLKDVKKSDPAYSGMQTLQKQLNNKSAPNNTSQSGSSNTSNTSKSKTSK